MRSQQRCFPLFILFLILNLAVTGCRETSPQATVETGMKYAKGFTIDRISEHLTEITVTAPWPQASRPLKYAFLDRQAAAHTTLNRDAYDGIVLTPAESLIATSTTHIPALEALGELGALTGFPDTRYISSEKARDRIDTDQIKDIGVNETINTEITLNLAPEVIIGFSIANENKSYDVLKRSGIPVVYNGDWVEQHPLGKAEWIKFFGVLFQKETTADSIFSNIEKKYLEAKALAQSAKQKPTVISGGMYRDVWYLPAGESWAAEFFEDANATYLWGDTSGTGSLSLSFESVLAKAADADIWLGAAQFTSYGELIESNQHYRQFKAFRDQKIYTVSKTLGAGGGVLFYELGPNRPDMVLKDMIHILHPELLPDHQPVFYKPLDPIE